MRIRRETLLPDAIAGLTGAVAGAPQAMGFALIAGVHPIYGLYAAFVATIVGALTTGSTFLTIAPTNALSLVVFSTLGGDAPVEKLFVLTLLVGVFQLGFGLLRLGDLTRFVSNAVMTGFITGAGVLIILGQLPNLTGYVRNTAVSGPLPKFWDWLTHTQQWDSTTLLLGLLAIGIIVLIRRTRLKYLATLTAIVVISALAVRLGLAGIATVGDIPSGLPHPLLPQIQYTTELLPAAIAMAVLSLVQSTGITQNIREPDDSVPDVNRDFIGQGLANLAGGIFQSMPSGGSLSRTAVNVSAGARSRMSNLFTGIYVGLILVALGSAIERITLTALAAQLIVAAFLLIKVSEIRLVWVVRTSARTAMAATFLSTLVLPLEFSVYIGVMLSLGLYVYSSAQNIKVVQLCLTEDKHFREEALPEKLPAHEAIVISVHGNLYFAAVRELERLLPPPASANGTVVILRLRNNRYLGSTGIHFLQRYSTELQAQGGKLMLVGVTPLVYQQLKRTEMLDVLGRANVLTATDTILDATEQALIMAQAWLKINTAHPD